MNDITWSKRALKQLRRIDAQFHADILAATDALKNMPHTSGVKALTHHLYGYRLRTGDFRVLFDWDGDIHIVEIQEVRKRDEQTY